MSYRLLGDCCAVVEREEGVYVFALPPLLPTAALFQSTQEYLQSQQVTKITRDEGGSTRQPPVLPVSKCSLRGQNKSVITYVIHCSHQGVYEDTRVLETWAEDLPFFEEQENRTGFVSCF